jgi:hypothetical protein
MDMKAEVLKAELLLQALDCKVDHLKQVMDTADALANLKQQKCLRSTDQTIYMRKG